MGYELERINRDFEDKSIVSINQFDLEDIEIVMREAADMEEMVDDEGRNDLLSDLMVANVFYEPSTRTFASFEAAAKRLGAGTIAIQGMDYSSVAKGESLPDTVATFAEYADTIVLRHKDEGAAKKASEASSVPVINGGDGVGEHPTQALLDLYTIQENFDSLDGLNVTMVGDLKHGRTVHSLARVLAKYNAHLRYVSPAELAMPEGIITELGDITQQSATTELGDALGDTDVLYVTRIQKERFESEPEYQKHQRAYTINADSLKAMQEDSIIMHPLPRVDEIDPEIDSDERAVYFDEVQNGMFVRMALLALVNGRSISE